MTYRVNWNPNQQNPVVLTLPDFVVRLATMSYKTPVEGQPGFVLQHVASGVRTFEGVDITYVVRKAVAEQLLLDTIRTDPTLGVEHPPEDPLASLDVQRAPRN